MTVVERAIELLVTSRYADLDETNKLTYTAFELEQAIDHHKEWFQNHWRTWFTEVLNPWSIKPTHIRPTEPIYNKPSMLDWWTVYVYDHPIRR